LGLKALNPIRINTFVFPAFLLIFSHNYASFSLLIICAAFLVFPAEKVLTKKELETLFFLAITIYFYNFDFLSMEEANTVKILVIICYYILIGEISR